MDINKINQLYESAHNSTLLAFKRNLVKYIDLILKDQKLNLVIQDFVNNAKTQSYQGILELDQAIKKEMLQTVNDIAEELNDPHAIEVIRKRIETSTDLEFVKDDLDDVITEYLKHYNGQRASKYLRFDKKHNFVGWHSDNYQAYLSKKAEIEHTKDYQIWFHWDNLLNFYNKAIDYKKNWIKRDLDIDKYKDHLQAFNTRFMELLEETGVKPTKKQAQSINEHGKMILFKDGQVKYNAPSGKETNTTFGKNTNYYKLLSYLSKDPQTLFSADELNKHLKNPKLGGEYSTPDRRVRDTISYIRSKLEIEENSPDDCFGVDKGNFGLNCDIELRS